MTIGHYLREYPGHFEDYGEINMARVVFEFDVIDMATGSDIVSPII
jgi:hypothetical protein